jgi:DNA-binding MarR family transcriptional regulator
LPRTEDDYNHQILQAIASGERVTQRSLSSRLGVALGLTNLLIRRLVAKGYVKVAGMGTRHVRYLMTGAGWEALARAARISLENTVHLYTETRELIRANLSAVSERCEADAAGQKRVVFYGAGDVAEIAYVSLQSTDLTLVGVVDDRRTGRFFDMTICGPEYLTAEAVGGVPYAHVVVTSVRHAESIRARLDARAIPANQVSCLDSVVKGDAARQAAAWLDPLLDEPVPAQRRQPRG